MIAGIGVLMYYAKEERNTGWGGGEITLKNREKKALKMHLIGLYTKQKSRGIFRPPPPSRTNPDASEFKYQDMLLPI